jgi:hypothetical protein
MNVIAAPIALTALALMLQSVDPFGFFQPTVSITQDQHWQLERGEPIARILPGQGREIAVFAAVRVRVDGERLAVWTQRIEELKKSDYVLGIRRFSDPPRLEDLAALTLDEVDLSEIRRCRPGNCGMKLGSAEMAELRRAAEESPGDWRSALQTAFRRVILQRVQTYLAHGQAALPAYEHRKLPVSPAAGFASMLEHSVFLHQRLPWFTEYLREYPRAAVDGVESFVYWSKERLGGKPIVSATHVSILKGSGGLEPDVLVAGKSLFATHYINASLGLTAIVAGESANYLVYLNRSEIDLVGGLFGGLVRGSVERRLRGEASNALLGLRRRPC